MPRADATPVALSIAGSDSSGGAGIQADLKTFSALGVYGATVVTAVTAQNTLGVSAIHNIPPEIVAAQLDAIFEDIVIRAVKIGMLADIQTINAVVAGLIRHRPPFVVLDPIMIATSGDRLFAADAIRTLAAKLLPLTDCLTPNLAEAAALLGTGQARSEAEMAAQGRALLALGPRSVLMKGGHAPLPEAVDVLVTAHDVQRYSAPRIETRNLHGTGCTLSAAIAAGIALGVPLAEAVGQAKTYLKGAIGAGRRFQIGQGNGPLNHFPDWPVRRQLNL